MCSSLLAKEVTLLYVCFGTRGQEFPKYLMLREATTYDLMYCLSFSHQEQTQLETPPKLTYNVILKP